MAFQHNTLSASLLELAYICPTAAGLKIHQFEKLHPDNEEAQDSFQGNIFEQTLESMPEYWLLAAAKAAPHINWPKRIERSNHSKLEGKDDLKNTVSTDAWLNSNIFGVPRIIYQSMIQGEFTSHPAIGHPDIILWTGSQYCIVDLKHTRQTRTEHAIQVLYYHELLSQTLARLRDAGLSPDKTQIAPLGVLIYCKPGALFRRRQGSTAIRESDLLAETFAYDSVRPELAKAYKMLASACTTGSAGPEFKPACNRCAYRHHCFDGTNHTCNNADILPLPAAAIEQLRSSGYGTIKATRQLLQTQAPPDLFSLLTRGNRDVANYLLRKCDQVEITGHSFEWQFPEAWATNYCIYARDFSIPLAAKRQPCSHKCRIVTGGEPCDEFCTWSKTPAVIVAFTHEEMHDFRSLLRSDSTLRSKLTGIPCVTLKEEIQRAYRGPVIAETITGYNKLFQAGIENAAEHYAAWAKRQKEWHTKEAETENRPRELAHQRARDLEKLWRRLTQPELATNSTAHPAEELLLTTA